MIEEAEDAGERGVGILRMEDGASRRRRLDHPVADDDRRSLGRRQLIDVLDVGEEREVAGLCLLETGDADDVHGAVPLEATAQTLSDVGKFQEILRIS